MKIIETAHAGVISNATPLSTVGMNMLNFLLSAVGIIAIIALVISGVMYLTSMGDPGKMQTAKNYAQNCVIGILLAMAGMIFIRLVGQFFQ